MTKVTESLAERILNQEYECNASRFENIADKDNDDIIIK